MSEFKFTAKDFSLKLPSNFVMDDIVDCANAKLAEWLKDAEIVYGTFDKLDVGFHYWHSQAGDADHTHRAKLVCIDPIANCEPNS
jgi:hypothetical protein